MKTSRALEALNFFMADVQAGIGPFLGPFLGVFLQARGWGMDMIGTVMSLGGIAGTLATSPAGALVDVTRQKRALIVVAGVMTAPASGLLWVSHDYWMVAASQVATAITGAAIGPALAGITLGVVRQRGFDRQFGRNQVANHAGNVVATALSGWLGWRYGFGAVFALLTFLALPVRGLIAASLMQAWRVWSVQALDGIGAGLQSVAVPALVVRLLNGIGRVNAGQGVVMTVQAAGAALSPALGGLLAHHFGYPTAFIALGAISTGSLALWLYCGAGLRHACRTHGGLDRDVVDSTPCAS